MMTYNNIKSTTFRRKQDKKGEKRKDNNPAFLERKARDKP